MSVEGTLFGAVRQVLCATPEFCVASPGEVLKIPELSRPVAIVWVVMIIGTMTIGIRLVRFLPNGFVPTIAPVWFNPSRGALCTLKTNSGRPGSNPKWSCASVRGAGPNEVRLICWLRRVIACDPERPLMRSAPFTMVTVTFLSLAGAGGAAAAVDNIAKAAIPDSKQTERFLINFMSSPLMRW